MLFSDTTFLLTFLPLVLAVHFLVVGISGRGWRWTPTTVLLANVVLLASSILFLMAALSPVLLGAMVAAVGLNYVVAYGIASAQGRDRQAYLPAELWLTVGVWSNLVLFGVARGLGGRATVESAFAVSGLLTPLAVSVFVAHALSYLLDVYRREAPPAKNPIQTGLYLLFFPLIVAGPIVRYRDIKRALGERDVRMGAFAYGVRRFVIGWVKSQMIAGTLAVPVDAAFGATAGELTVLLAWIGVVGFTLQVYFELSGYADMAVGMGRFFGFRFKDNYLWPYSAESVHDFWGRWNVSLFAWCRGYLKLRLDGDDRTAVPAYWKAFALFVVVGAWHGLTAPVMVWAGYHSGLLFMERAGFRSVLASLPSVVRHTYVVSVVGLGWVFFRADSPTHALVVVQALAGFGAQSAEVPNGLLTAQVWLAVALGAAAAGRLPAAVSRWSVTLDAMTASVMMLVWATLVFCWRPFGRVVNLVLPHEKG